MGRRHEVFLVRLLGRYGRIRLSDLFHTLRFDGLRRLWTSLAAALFPFLIALRYFSCIEPCLPPRTTKDIFVT